MAIKYFGLNRFYQITFKKIVADKHQKLIFEIPLGELCMGFIEPYINTLTIDFNQFLAKPFEKGYVTPLYILYLLIMYIISHPQKLEVILIFG
jgi:hypothetical protein